MLVNDFVLVASARNFRQNKKNRYVVGYVSEKYMYDLHLAGGAMYGFAKLYFGERGKVNADGDNDDSERLFTTFISRQI